MPSPQTLALDAPGASVPGRSTRTYLLALSLALALPVALVAISLAIGLQRSEQRRFEALGRETVRTGALAIDLDAQGLKSTLQLLAASQALAEGDLAAFRGEALTMAGIEGAVVVLRDPAGLQVVNSHVPAGSPLPIGSNLADIDREVLRTGLPTLSNRYVGIVEPRPLVAMVVPVRRNGQIVYLLSAAVGIERFRNVLRRYATDQWRIGLIDRDGVVITRVRDPDISGTRPPAVAAAAAKADRGYFELTADDGDPSAVVFQRASGGWTVLGVASIADFRAAQLNRIGLALAGSLTLGLLGIGAALAVANRIGRPLRALTADAGRLSRGETVAFSPSSNVEANNISHALSQASEALRAREAELAATHALYKNLFESIDGPVCIAELIRDARGQAVDYRYLDVNPAYRRQLGHDDVVGRTRRETFPNDPPSWLDVFERVAKTGESARFEFEMKSRGLWFVAHATRLPMARDQLAVICEEITERKRAEATRELLINELNHRVKNTLTAVLSMATQSFRPPATLEEGRHVFAERIMALSRAHNVLTRRNWEDAELGEIASESIKPFDSAEGCRIGIGGPIVVLSPKQALAIAMVLHELATNALKHGALSVDTGRVDLEWSVAGGVLTIDWRELGGPPARTSDRRGFGTRLIERSLDGDLGGAATMDFGPGGLRCRLTIPFAAANADSAGAHAGGGAGASAEASGDVGP